MNETLEQQAQNMADGLGIAVWITADGRRIVQQRPVSGGTEVRPGARAKRTPPGSPAETKPTGDAS
jgi:hypothetical protein